MKTLTIELPDDVATAAEKWARRANMTLAAWITPRIAEKRHPSAEARDPMGYPIGWFETTTGSLADVEDIAEPADRPTAAITPIEL